MHPFKLALVTPALLSIALGAGCSADIEEPTSSVEQQLRGPAGIDGSIANPSIGVAGPISAATIVLASGVQTFPLTVPDGGCSAYDGVPATVNKPGPDGGTCRTSGTLSNCSQVGSGCICDITGVSTGDCEDDGHKGSIVDPARTQPAY